MDLNERRGGTIAVLSGDRTTLPKFSQALAILGKPEDTRLIWLEGHDVAGNRNQACENFRGNWLLFLDDDMVFDPDLLIRLLRHEKDVIVPLCVNRGPPFDPTVYMSQREDGLYVGGISDLPQSGITEVFAAGTAGMLIRRHVLDAVGEPWFEERGGPNEDLTFCAKVREHFSIWCDVDTRMGHMALHTVWPAYREGGWHADVDFGPRLRLPLRRELKEEAAA